MVSDSWGQVGSVRIGEKIGRLSGGGRSQRVVYLHDEHQLTQPLSRNPDRAPLHTFLDIYRLRNANVWLDAPDAARANRAVTQLRPLSVIGAGHMGEAVARAAAGRDLPCTVWTRREAQRDQLARTGLRVAPSLQDAFSEGAIVILLLRDYRAARQLLEANAIALRNCVIVNLMTGTQTEAADFRDAVHRGGGLYLDGVIHAYPEDVAAGAASMSFGGDGAAWAAAEANLAAITSAASYIGDDVGAPNALDAVFSGAFHLVALGAFFEAAAFARALGLSHEAFGGAAKATAAGLVRQITKGLEEIEAGTFETDQATLSVYAAAARAWRAQMIEAGQRASLSTANLHNLEIAEAAGLGDRSISVQVLTAGTFLTARRPGDA